MLLYIFILNAGVFGTVVVVVMLNVLIAMLSSTYEGVMETASVAFQKYNAERVIHLRSMPRCPPCVFLYERFLRTIGWFLRTIGVMSANSERLALSGVRGIGWCARPGFEWEWANFKPDPKSVESAERAIEAARRQLCSIPGVTATAKLKAAGTRLRRMRDQKDGNATRRNVENIVLAVVGEEFKTMNTRINALEDKLGGLDSKVNTTISKVISLLKQQN